MLSKSYFCTAVIIMRCLSVTWSCTVNAMFSVHALCIHCGCYVRALFVHGSMFMQCPMVVHCLMFMSFSCTVHSRFNVHAMCNDRALFNVHVLFMHCAMHSMCNVCMYCSMFMRCSFIDIVDSRHLHYSLYLFSLLEVVGSFFLFFT